MKLGYELTIEQTQKLSMTPELIQAIKILQLNNMDLTDYVQTELLENPILEEDKRAAENDGEPAVVEIDIRDKIVEDNYDDDNYKQWENSSDHEDYSFEQYTSAEETLQDFLNEQLQLSRLEGRQKEICSFIIDAIDDNGYLTMTTEEIMAAFDAEEDEVENVLAYVQNMEPSGVGARNLAECLEIQLAARGLLTDEMEFVIENMLQDVADNKISAIAREVGLKNDQVQQMIDLLRTLEPKPGRQFATGGETTRYVVPDIIVEKINGEYVVSTNETSIPKLMVSSYYSQLSQSAKHDEELNKYLTNRFNSAMWLIRSIEQRKQTIFNVAVAIVHYQIDFFDNGEKYIRTLTLKQIADELGIHESTVSRAINGKYMQSPRGVFELKYFFSSGVSVSSGEGLSSNSVKSIIKDMIDGEDQKKPLSDQDMVEMLKEKGIEISRRTVAKYRESMGIQSSSKRRRY
jgi:RNA polymerase sigma-54 factor